MKKKNGIFSSLYMWLVLAFFYLPILYVVIFSFNRSKSLSNFTGFSLKWYESMFNNRSIMEAIGTTVIIAVIATIVSTIIGTVTAIGLSKSKKVVRELINQVNNLPMLNPEIVTAIGFMLFFTSLRIETGFMTMLLAHIVFCVPYVMLSVTPRLRRLDPNLAEAAMDLGCTPWQAMWKVIIPQIKEGIIAGALVAFSMSFDDFVISLFTTGPGVSNISIYVYSNVKRVNPTINALSALIVYVVTIVLIIVNVAPIIQEKRAKKNAMVETGENDKRRNPILKIALAGCVALIGIFGGLYVMSRPAGTGDGEEIQTVDANTVYGCNVLNVYNAGEYIGEDVVSNFETLYNARVNYDTFESNEIMYTKLLGGNSYDVLIPSDYMIERLISEDLLQPLNKDQMTHEADLNPAVLDIRESFDEGGVYSMPYFWGTVGIVYDTTIIDEATIQEQGWEILRNTDYKGNLYYYDSQRDGFMIALKALGYSMNTDNDEEIQEAYEWLKQMNDTMEPAYVTDEVIDGMVNSNKALAVVYSGDAAYVLSENADMAWYEPEQGTNKWVDAMVIPANSSCPGLANEFINYMASYDVQYANSEYVGYTPVRLDVQNDLGGEEGDYYENTAYAPRTDGKLDESFHYNEKLTKKLSDLWNKVKIQ